MAFSVSPALSEKRAQAGRRGALKRWGPPGTRVVRLGDLTLDQRRLVLALVAAAKETAPANDQPGAVTTEGTRDANRQS